MTAEVIDGEQSVVFDQAENRLRILHFTRLLKSILVSRFSSLDFRLSIFETSNFRPHLSRIISLTFLDVQKAIVLFLLGL
jgi:hypothetical protein